jgi:toxin ParE1/3/4
MKIIWTGKAEKQLDQIFRYIEVDSVLFAHRTVETIIERVESVAQHPRMGRKVPEYQHDDIREVFHHPPSWVYVQFLVGLSETASSFGLKMRLEIGNFGDLSWHGIGG